MSKFWAADSDESSSDSSSDDSSSSSDSSVANNKAGDNRWVMDSDSGTLLLLFVFCFYCLVYIVGGVVYIVYMACFYLQGRK